MTPSIRSVLAGALLALALAACGGSPAPSQPAVVSQLNAVPDASPAPTEAPQPTATHAPTAAPLPAATEPSAGPEPTAAPAAPSGPLADAVAKTRGASTYRIEMSIFSKGLIDTMASPSRPISGTIPAPVNVPLMTMAGDFAGQDSHFTMRGLFAGFLGVDPAKGLEAMTVAGQSYVHGPVPMLGADKAIWYVADPSQSAVARPPVDSREFLGSLTGEGADVSMFQQVGGEKIDRRSCDIYAGDRDATLAAFRAANAGGGPDELGDVKDAVYRYWVCDDGYVHQIQLTLTGTSRQQPDQRIDFRLRVHIWDFESPDISIEAPPKAQPLAASGGETATAVP